MSFLKANPHKEGSCHGGGHTPLALDCYGLRLLSWRRSTHLDALSAKESVHFSFFKAEIEFASNLLRDATSIIEEKPQCIYD
jgi:hypothetical protein